MIDELLSRDVSKVIEHLIIHERWEQDINSMASILKMKKSKLRKIMFMLERFQIAECVNVVKKNKYYKINQKSNLVNPLRKIIIEFNILYAIKTTESENKCAPIKNHL